MLLFHNTKLSRLIKYCMIIQRQLHITLARINSGFWAETSLVLTLITKNPKLSDTLRASVKFWGGSRGAHFCLFSYLFYLLAKKKCKNENQNDHLMWTSRVKYIKCVYLSTPSKSRQIERLRVMDSLRGRFLTKPPHQKTNLSVITVILSWMKIRGAMESIEHIRS